ncbi:MAG: serpin family protein [Bacteroidota bacterium]|nr:serpin family protein [Bacteroidota bacterium]
MQQRTTRLPYRTLLFSTLAVLLLAACADDSTGPAAPTPMRALTAKEASINRANGSFAFDVFDRVAKTEGSGNVFLSPLSISMALGMTMNGAAGETRDGMRETLHLDAMSAYEINNAWKGLRTLLLSADPAVALTIANSIWSRDGFAVEQAFIDSNRHYFDAEVRSLDFDDPGAADVINAWVRERTRDRIQGIVDAPIPALTMMYLINAVYFKGQWKTQFDPAKTQDAPFAAAAGPQQTVPTMRREGVMRYLDNGELQMVDLPYGWDRFSMAVLLPDEGRDIAALRASLAEPGTWTALQGSLIEREILLLLPRFRLEYEAQLDNVLAAMGMDEAFDPNVADFSGINAARELYISSVKHKTFVEVNEEGTEAAAVTSVEIGTVSMPPTMQVNRPFLFVIHERNTGAVLFVGQVNGIDG